MLGLKLNHVSKRGPELWNNTLDLQHTWGHFRLGDAYVRQRTVSSLVQIMVCRLLKAKPWSKPMLPVGTSINKCQWNFNHNTVVIREDAIEIGIGCLLSRSQWIEICTYLYYFAWVTSAALGGCYFFHYIIHVISAVLGSLCCNAGLGQLWRIRVKSNKKP